jgi:superfamily II DNA or RNA helicase
MVDNFYIKENKDWINKLKYGYVNGDKTNLINRLNNSTEEHSELSSFTNIFSFEKTNKYELYKEIDKIISLLGSDIKKIEIVEKMYDITLPLLRELNEYLVKSNTKQSNEFIYNDGIKVLIRVLKEEFPLLGLQLVKEYTIEEIESINNSSREQHRKQQKEKDNQNYENLMKLKILMIQKRKCDKLKKPLRLQIPIIQDMINYFKINNVGYIIEPCGLGKTFLSIYLSKILDYKNILIGTPTIFLQKQMENEIEEIILDYNILFVGGDDETDIDIIYTEINKQRNIPLFIITTYSSCYKLNNINFDFKIGDECHHLSSINNNDKGYNTFHNILSNKSLYMTATKKIVDTNNSEIKKYSMDDESIFGKCIDEKTVKWAIENNVITDYKAVVIKTDVETIEDILSDLEIDLQDKNKELFVATYMTLKSLDSYDDLTHILCYTNTKENAELVKTYIDLLLDKNIFDLLNKNKFYNKALHSDSNCNLTNEVNIMKSKQYGIISCVYIFGEGFNLPKLNGVCFVENMVSTIRIIQCALRPARIDRDNLSKTAYLLIPFIDNNDFNEETNSHKNIRSIISNLGNQDENIEQRLIVNTLTKRKYLPQINNSHYVRYDLDNEDLELRRLKLRLRRSKDLKSKISEEEEEYLYHKTLLQKQNLKSKQEYDLFEYDDKIKNIEEYFKKKCVWPDKGWYDMLSIDTTNYPSTKEEWKRLCKEKNICSMKDYKEYSERPNSDLPLEPDKLYYKEWNSSIEVEIGIIRPRRR